MLVWPYGVDLDVTWRAHAQAVWELPMSADGGLGGGPCNGHGWMRTKYLSCRRGRAGRWIGAGTVLPFALGHPDHHYYYYDYYYYDDDYYRQHTNKPRVAPARRRCRRWLLLGMVVVGSGCDRQFT